MKERGVQSVRSSDRMGKGMSSTASAPGPALMPWYTRNARMGTACDAIGVCASVYGSVKAAEDGARRRLKSCLVADVGGASSCRSKPA